MLLIFTDVFSGTLGFKKKSVSKQRFSFSGTPESLDGPGDWVELEIRLEIIYQSIN